MKKILILSYYFLIFLFVLFSYFFIDPNLSYLKIIYSGFSIHERTFTSIIYIAFIIIIFFYYYLFLKLVRKKVIDKKNIKRIIIMISLLFVFSYPSILSYDIFNYMATAKVLYFYKENPYIIMPIEFIRDPAFTFVRASNKISLYGPFWLLLTGFPYFIGFNNFILTLFSFKLLNLIFYFLTLLTIWKISKKDLFAVSFFALNPLILIETLISNHNDIEMMFLALLSFYLLFYKKKTVGFIALFLSVLIKYSTLILIPVYIYWWIKYKKKNLANTEKVIYYSFISMIIVFILSPLREEMYSWYAIWFLTFACFLYKNKLILYLSIFVSFGLLISYLPYVYSGLYSNSTIILKYLIILSSVIIGIICYYLRRHISIMKFLQ